MPLISRFYGIEIYMFYNGHAPPHFHAVYGNHEAMVHINPIQIGHGRLPPRARAMVFEWALRHEANLMENWRMPISQGAQTDCRFTIMAPVRIQQVWSQPGYKLELQFSDGTSGVVDFLPLISRGGVYAKLKDKDIFSHFDFDSRGRSLVFRRAGIDFCADALWLQVKQSSNQVKPKPFKKGPLKGYHPRDVADAMFSSRKLLSQALGLENEDGVSSDALKKTLARNKSRRKSNKKRPSR